jgi:ADP-ribose pyrophosphatase
MSFRLIDRQQLYDGKKVKLELHHLEDEDGHRQQREIVVHPGAVVILPLLEDGTVILIRNRRYAVGEILLELPAGTLEKGEDPMNCAGRELLEETGWLAGRLRPLATFYTSPGILSERMFAFVAEELVEKKQALEEGEEIELHPVPYDEAICMIRDGQIVDGKTIAALLMHDRFFRNAPAGQAGDDDPKLPVSTEGD